jgi:hypothetical protein
MRSSLPGAELGWERRTCAGPLGNMKCGLQAAHVQASPHQDALAQKTVLAHACAAILKIYSML